MDAVEIVQISSALISSIACLFIISVSLTSEFLRKGYPYKYIFVLSIFDFIWATNRIIPLNLIPYNAYCQFQACINQSFHLASVMWTAFMSFEMFIVTIFDKRPDVFGFYKPLIVILTFCLLTCIPALLLGVFNKIEGWCWIGGDKFGNVETFLYRLAFFYVICWICIIWNTFVAFKVRERLKVKFGRDDHGLIKRLKLYPISLVICYIPMTLYRLIDPWKPVPTWFICLAIFIGNLEGFFNTLIFGFSLDVKQYLKKICLNRSLTEARFMELNQRN